MIRFKLIRFKTTAFTVVMILKILKFHFKTSLLVFTSKMLHRTRNISRAEEWENLILNLTVTLQNYFKKAGHCLINALMFPLKFVFVLSFSLLLNFCCFNAECNERFFQVTTSELQLISGVVT